MPRRSPTSFSRYRRRHSQRLTPCSRTIALSARLRFPEAKNLRQRLKTAESERDRLKSLRESDLERREREHNEVRAERDRLARTASTLCVDLAARELGIVDPEAAAAVLDLDAVDDPTDPKANKRPLRELVKEKPYLAPQGGKGFDGGSGKGPRACDPQLRQDPGLRVP
jgi:hypothetical protein